MSTVQISPFDRAQTVAAKGLMTLPPRLQVLLAGGREKRIDGQQMDPQIQLLVTLMNADGFTLRDPDHLVARESFAHDMAALGDQAAGGRVDARDRGRGWRPARCARGSTCRSATAPRARCSSSCTAAAGSSATSTRMTSPCRFLARHSGAAVVSVDYRLAPEHPFPAPVDDSLAAFRDVVARAEELGADPERIGIGGDSAGGHLSAVVALLARARRRAGARAPGPDLPGHRRAAARAPSRELFAEKLPARGGRHGLGDRELRCPTPSDRGDDRASPLLRRGPRPASRRRYVVTAGFDPLRDEGEAYAARLREAGVPTTLRRQRGMTHGFIGLVSISTAAQRAMAEIAGAIQVGLAPPAR